MQRRSMYLPILTLVGLVSAGALETFTKVSEPNSELESKWTTGEQQEMLGTFIHVDKTRSERRNSEHVGEVSDVPDTVGDNARHGEVSNGEEASSEQGSSRGSFSARNENVEFRPSLRMDVVPLQPAQPSEPSTPLESSGPVPPRSARDYPASSDNYGWTYPSSIGATAAGSASYYPSAEYGKPSGGDSKYYSWAAPGDDKYKRPSYFTYQGGAPVECIPIPMAGIITEMTKGGGTMDVKNSLIRNVLSALVALFVIKIPIMIALKALVFKLFILPASLLMIGLPVLMPLLYFFLPSFMKDKDKTTTAKPATMVMMMSNPNSTRATRRLYDDPIGGRTARTLFRPDGSVTDDFEDLLRTLIGEQSCVEKIACQFGVRDAQSQYRKPISWVLKYVQTLKPVLSDPALRTKLKLYREAYNFGADIAASNTTSAHDAQVVCSDTLYPCQKPQVIVKQARTLYKLF